MKRICKRCSREYEDEINVASPMGQFGEIFLNIAEDSSESYCPDCKEEIGMMNLLGFGE